MNTITNSFLVFFSKIFVGGFIFLWQIIIARFLGARLLGVSNLFLEIIDIAFLIGGLGFGTASIYLLNKAKKDFPKLFANSFIFGAIWGLVLSFLAFLMYKLYPALFNGLPFRYLVIALFIIPVVLIYNYLLSLLLAKFKIVAWALFSILYSFLLFSLTFIFIVFLKLGADGAIYAILTAVLINFILTLFYLLKLRGPSKSFDFPLLMTQLKFGISAYLGDVFTKMNFKINIFIVNIFLGILNVGYYTVSYTMAALVFLIPYSLQQVLYPAWSSDSEEKIDEKTPAVAKQALLVSIFIAVFLAIIGRFFILFFYGKEFLPSVIPFYLILPAGIFAAYAGIFFNNFFAKGKSHITSFILIASLLINILFGIVFIPLMGIAGVSLATSISYGFSAIAAIFIFWRVTKTPIKDILFFQPSDITAIFRHFLNFLPFK